MGEPKDDDFESAQVLGEIAVAMRPAELTGAERKRMRGRILDRIAGAEPPPEGTQTWRAHEPGWSQRSGLIDMKMLRIDAAAGTQEVLIRFKPGAYIPAHSHAKEEQMIILEGECLLGDHPLRAGDIHVAPAGSWHPPITTQTGTLLLLRCEYPFPANR